jgi:outer membrane lipopolysaccharide assembly protein LptE/RlpB
MKPPRSKPLLAAFLALLLLAALAPACGYHMAGQGSSLPPTIKTIAIPVFANDSFRFRIEQKVSAAVTREFIERTSYQITASPAQADAVLRGTIKDVHSSVVAFDLTTGRATSSQVQVTAEVELVDLHTKKVLFKNPKYIFREQYQISQTPSSQFEEDQPALDRLSRDLARTLVTEILENF